MGVCKYGLITWQWIGYPSNIAHCLRNTSPAACATQACISHACWQACVHSLCQRKVRLVHASITASPTEMKFDVYSVLTLQHLLVHAPVCRLLACSLPGRPGRSPPPAAGRALKWRSPRRWTEWSAGCCSRASPGARCTLPGIGPESLPTCAALDWSLGHRGACGLGGTCQQDASVSSRLVCISLRMARPLLRSPTQSQCPAKQHSLLLMGAERSEQACGAHMYFRRL